MRNSIFTLLFLALPIITIAQPDCASLEEILVTECGTVFDLCMDNYTMHANEGLELAVFSNDMGMFDVCASDTSIGPCHGTIERMPNCNWFYVPDPGYVGFDTFYYAMVVNDFCTDEIYCEKDDGKIWTVNSYYTGPNDASVEVYSKNGNDMDSVDTATDLNYGEYFLIDGSHLPKSQANWFYHFYYDGNNSEVPDTIIKVHTSCSQLIFGVDFTLFRPISGCIATHKDRGNCSSSVNREGINTRAMSTVTTQTIDTTMVIIDISLILPIEISDFSLSNKRSAVSITWTISSVINEDYLELEKSYDGINYYPIERYDDIEVGTYSYSDSEVGNEKIIYYRLATTNYEGITQYSDILMTRRSPANEDMPISIYPNPLKEIITVDIDNYNEDLGINRIAIYNTAGSLITDGATEGSIVTLPVGDKLTPDGLYIVKITLSNGISIYRKIIKG